MIQIEQLFISARAQFLRPLTGGPAGHDPWLRCPKSSVSEAGAFVGIGFRLQRELQRPDYFFSLDVFDLMCAELNLTEIQPSATRRNAYLRGVDLNDLIGNEFQVQGVRFVGVQECAPCSWMNSAVGPGAEQWLKGRGGLRARILSDGVVRCSDIAVRSALAVSVQ